MRSVDPDLVILIDAYKRHDWLVGAVDKRLWEEFGKLQVEINDEKSRIVDLERGKSFGFLGFDFRSRYATPTLGLHSVHGHGPPMREARRNCRSSCAVNRMSSVGATIFRAVARWRATFGEPIVLCRKDDGDIAAGHHSRTCSGCPPTMPSTTADWWTN